MKRMKNLLIAGLLIVAGFVNAQAQVRDISVVVSPRMSYNWWNENIALNNSPFYGLNVGFGVGPFLEIRGTFEKSFNLKNALQDKSWNPFTAEQLHKLDGMQIDVSRFGGELKLNVLNGFLVSPYITAGAGVQKIDYNPFSTDAKNLDEFMAEARAKESQLFVSLGAGVKLNLTERVALSLEGKNIRFNMDPNNGLLNPNVNKEAKRWGNWSALASLDFYLGGSTVNTDHRDLYTDGFKGMKFVLEPAALYVDFSNKLNLTNQWYLGGSAGLDFGSLIGLRAFYYQATQEPNKLSFNFNKDQKIYGAKLITRLNQPRGIVPYLQLGAGYIDNDNFIDAPTKQAFKTHNLFALAGAGVEVPLSKYFALFGTANAMLMADKSVKPLELTQPTDVVTSMAYSGGLRINIGAAATEPSYPEYSKAEQDDINKQVTAMRTAEGEELEKDDEPQKRTIFETRSQKESRKQSLPAGKMMTKKEFEEMVERILEKVRAEEKKRASNYSESDIDLLLSLHSAQQGRQQTGVAVQSNDQLIQEIRSLTNAIQNQKGRQVVTPAPVVRTQVVPAPVVPGHQGGGYVAGNEARVSTVQHHTFKLNRIAPVTGVNLGEGFQWVIGARGYLQISDTRFDFVPELMLGFGSRNSFDLAASVIYNIPLSNQAWKPYFGLGLGFFGHGKGMKPGVNTVLGTAYTLNNGGELFADYSIRGLFRNNQIAVGYRFVF